MEGKQRRRKLQFCWDTFGKGPVTQGDDPLAFDIGRNFEIAAVLKLDSYDHDVIGCYLVV